MTALLLVAHGSRHPGTAAVLEGLATSVRQALSFASPSGGLAANGYDDQTPSSVRVVWLELIEPSLDQACRDLKAEGEDSAIIVPLLFTEAFHRTVDLPEQVEAATRDTGISLETRDGLGLGEGVRRAFLERIGNTTDDVLIMAVGSSNAEANGAIHAFARDVDSVIPGQATAAFTVAAPQPLGIDAVLAAARQAARMGRSLRVVPLFTAPGLLWDNVVNRAAEQFFPCEVTFADPLGDLLSNVVINRWSAQ